MNVHIVASNEDEAYEKFYDSNRAELNDVEIFLDDILSLEKMDN